jgi:hypothetical protein
MRNLTATICLTIAVLLGSVGRSASADEVLLECDIAVSDAKNVGWDTILKKRWFGGYTQKRRFWGDWGVEVKEFGYNWHERSSCSDKGGFLECGPWHYDKHPQRKIRERYQYILIDSRNSYRHVCYSTKSKID